MKSILRSGISASGVLLLFCAGCAARKPSGLLIPRPCITAIELMPDTKCVQLKDGGVRCFNLKLSYKCTEVARATK